MGDFPWNGIYNIDVRESLKYNDTIENLGITENFDLVGYSGDITRYTTIFFFSANKVKKKSLVLIAESANYKGKVYFLTDGLSDPIWLSIYELESYIQKQGNSLANAAMLETPNGAILQPIKGTVDTVDFTKYQLEYRNYLKSKKGHWYEYSDKKG